MSGTKLNLSVANTHTDSAAVSQIDVLTTGWGEQHKEHRYGSWMPQILWVLLSRNWVKIPINAFLIHHRNGPVLFDTGIDPAIASDPNYISQAIGRVLMDRIFKWHLSEEDALRHQLRKTGISASQIQKVVISHLHFDHVGGIADVPNSELIVSEREWAQLSEPHPEREWILSEHIKIPGSNWRPVPFEKTDDPLFEGFDGTFDVMGDGTLTLLPTPGHTPGSISMFIRSTKGPPVLLIGDLAYTAQAIMEDQVPGTGDAKELRLTYKKVRQLKKDIPNLLIVPSHDDEAVAKLNTSFKQEYQNVEF